MKLASERRNPKMIFIVRHTKSWDGMTNSLLAELRSVRNLNSSSLIIAYLCLKISWFYFFIFFIFITFFFSKLETATYIHPYTIMTGVKMLFCIFSWSLEEPLRFILVARMSFCVFSLASLPLRRGLLKLKLGHVFVSTLFVAEYFTFIKLFLVP